MTQRQESQESFQERLDRAAARRQETERRRMRRKYPALATLCELRDEIEAELDEMHAMDEVLRAVGSRPNDGEFCNDA